MANVARDGMFAGSARYQIVRTLGAGGMGVVYEAHDRERNVRVALKTLKAIDARALFRFKQEFRALAGLDHPNLIQLHELVADGDQWFFTMDYVRGTDLMAYIRKGATNIGAIDETRTREFIAADTDMAAVASELSGPVASRSGSIPGLAADYQSDSELKRIRHSFAQLAEGLVALHTAGKLHRDIKPTNVMVTDDGRVVLLDFGLVAQMDQLETEVENGSDEDLLDAEDSGRSYQTMNRFISGTAAYMAPEQAARQPLAEASDWYAVGTMLFEALTGRLPFQGATLELLRKKMKQTAPAPSDVAADVPDDLNLLCVRLLERNPEERPTGAEILKCLSSDRPGTLTAVEHFEIAPFVGRKTQLATLHDAFDGVRSGQTVVVEIEGLSGMGKSRLVDHFLAGLQHGHDAVVLKGRCYEQESVPYKAIDGLIDELTRLLLRLPEKQRSEWLPAELPRLARLFPVLNQIPELSERVADDLQSADPREIRRWAFRALADLLHAIGGNRPLVISIDDLQWGDADSAILLNELLQSDVSLRALILLAYRGEYVESSPCLKSLRSAAWRRRGIQQAALLGADAIASQTLRVEELQVRPLSQDGIHELIKQVHPEREALAESTIEQIARESGGSPYLVLELVRWVVSGRELLSSSDAVSGLDEVLWARASELPPASRQLLEAIAVAGQPIAMRHAFHASGLEQIEPRSMKLLTAGHFIRSSGTGFGDEVATFHDRVRHSVTAHVGPAAKREIYRKLAISLETDPAAERETIADCFFKADENSKAAEYYIIAAGIAEGALAFLRAAMLYRRAIELHRNGGVDQLELQRKLADALANGGRGTEAADEYQAVAAAVEGRQKLELEGLAAFHYCTGARIGKGRRLLQRALGSVGLALPESPILVLLSLARQRLLQRIRGNRFVSRDASQVKPRELLRIDIGWNAAKALSLFDTVSGVCLQTRVLRMALRCGEPTRIVYLMAWESATLSTSKFGFDLRYSVTLLKLARSLAEETGDPYCLGMVELAEAGGGLCTGDFERGVQHAVLADKWFREGCTGVTWERDTSQMFHTWSLLYRGLFAELGPFSEAALFDAEDRGDVYAATTHAVYALPIARLAAGDPDSASRALELNLARWSRSGFHLQHLLALATRSAISIYQGRPEDAWDGLTNSYRDVKRSLLLEVRIVEIIYFGFRGRAAVATWFEDRSHLESARFAERDANRLARMKVGWATPQANAIRAGLAAIRNETEVAEQLLRRAVEGFDQVRMEAFAAASRIRLGILLDNAEGSRLRAQGEEWMRSQNVADIPRMLDVLVPGFACSTV